MFDDNKINGTCLVFTDLHYGKQRDCLQNIKTCDTVIDVICSEIKTRGVDHVIFLGDWYDNRDSLNVNTITSSCKSMKKLSSLAKVHLILGNHDMYNRNTSDVNSAEMFKDMVNVFVYDKPVIKTINGSKCLFAPWLTDFTKYSEEEFDNVFGHLDVLPRQLFESFEQKNICSVKAGNSISNELESFEILSSDSEETEHQDQPTVDSMMHVVKKNGNLFLGHIHQHSKHKYHGRNQIFVGSPWQQDMSEIDSKDGFYIIDENMEYSFREITETPHIIEIKISDIVNKGVDVYDFSKIRGNTVHLNYDVDVDQYLNANIIRRIGMFNPHHEIRPNYNLPVKFVNDNSSLSSTDEILTLEKFFKEYVNLMDNDTIDKSGFLDKSELLSVINEYYESAKEIEGEII